MDTVQFGKEGGKSGQAADESGAGRAAVGGTPLPLAPRDARTHARTPPLCGAAHGPPTPASGLVIVRACSCNAQGSLRGLVPQQLAGPLPPTHLCRSHRLARVLTSAMRTEIAESWHVRVPHGAMRLEPGDAAAIQVCSKPLVLVRGFGSFV